MTRNKNKTIKSKTKDPNIQGQKVMIPCDRGPVDDLIKHKSELMTTIHQYLSQNQRRIPELHHVQHYKEKTIKEAKREIKSKNNKISVLSS